MSLAAKPSSIIDLSSCAFCVSVATALTPAADTVAWGSHLHPSPRGAGCSHPNKSAGRRSSTRSGALGSCARRMLLF